MTVDVRRASGRLLSPWKNGGGITREVASAATPAAPEEFDWRISLADIEAPGSFSSYPGLDRVILALAGANVELTVDGTRNVLHPSSPFCFPGDAETFCALEGSARVLNVMSRRGRCRSTLGVLAVTAGTVLSAQAQSLCLLMALSETVVSIDSNLVELAELDAVQFSTGCECHVLKDAKLARVDIAYIHSQSTDLSGG